MKRFTREVRQVIRLEGWNLLAFEMFYRMATVPLYLWILNKMFGFTLKMAGYSFLTAENIKSYFLKPWTFVCVLLLGASAAVFLMVEKGGLISAFQAAAYYRRVNALEMMAGGIKKTADELGKKNWKLFILVLAQTLFFNQLFLYRILIRIRPVNFIMDEFFSSKAGWIIFLAGTVLLAVWVLPGIFTFHGCMIEQKSFEDSYRRSRRIVTGRWQRIFLPLIGYHGAVIAVFIAGYVIFAVFVSLAAVNFSRTGMSKIVILSLKDRAELFWILMAGAAVSLVYYGASTVQYYHYTSQITGKKRWNFEYPADRLLERKKVLTALAVIGSVNVMLMYDAFRNGLGAAEDILLEIPVTAHRGSSREAPENTMAAIERAVDNMAEYTEIDVQMTKDGKIVLSHDRTLKRTAGVNKKIQDMTYEEVEKLDVGAWFSAEFKGEKIPSLQEIMDYAKGRIKLNIEIKDEGRSSVLPEETMALIEEYDMSDQCVISSVNLNYLRRAKEKIPEITAGYIISAAFGDYYSDEAIDFISIRSSLVDKRLIGRVHEEGKAVHVWTVNSKSELERMKLLQADNIITDFPVKAKEIIYGELEGDSVLECMKLLLK